LKSWDIVTLFSSTINLSLLIHDVNRIFATSIGKSLICCWTLLALLLLELNLVHHFAMEFFFFGWNDHQYYHLSQRTILIIFFEFSSELGISHLTKRNAI
jgi:phosphate starvation-inducible membrane PsiE